MIGKNVGDFRQWEQHAVYEKAFDRLPRDLKADDKQKTKAKARAASKASKKSGKR